MAQWACTIGRLDIAFAILSSPFISLDIWKSTQIDELCWTPVL
jgi:hypothetical protein